ncbi:MAG: PEGA domain-containing protein, partial [Candidatus Curtissbacteria bacterium]|nr:PEGA domain-containing protein [Candidatus Curtissbacteria bacterium]
MTQKRILIFVFVALFIALGGYGLIQFAKGYRFNLAQKNFQPSGLLVATSTPDGAQIFVNGELKSATNTTLYLAPGTYNVELKKDGFRLWQKTLKIDKEMVSRTDAWLFPIVPDFRASTYTGASNPSLSPDNSKIIYTVSGNLPEKDGLWVLELSDMPFVSQEPRQILKSLPHNRDLSKVTFNWSSDSRQVLVAAHSGKTEENYLLDSTVLNSPNILVDMTPNLQIIQKQWATEKQIKQDQKMAKLPKALAQLLIDNANQILFSPDETKILYSAIKDVTIPDGLISLIPSFSNQPQ